jgi:hypothetical protein
MEKEKIIMDNWMEFHPVITEDDLGWNEECIRDAMSEDPKEIFDYFWRNFFSIIFYYVDDGNFYELFMESEPHKFWRIPKIKTWDGQYVGRQIQWENHHEGDVLFEFTDDTDLWNTLRINGKPIGEVLERSFIAEIE